MTETETEWVANRRPAIAEPDAESTEAARHLLLEHLEAPSPARDGHPRRRRLAAVLVPASILAAVAIFVTGTDGGAPGHGPAGLATADALPRLAEQLREKPKLVGGDATLIVREQSYPGTDKQPILGYDLYADDGRYFYAPSRSALPAAVEAGPETGSASIQREVEAAADAFHGDINTARTRMIDSVLKPGQGYAPGAAEVRKDPVWQDNWVWGNSYDALVGGAGRPDVRAGVLHLLDSVDGVTVDHVSVGGRPALKLTAPIFGDGYVEELTIDADTGIPLRFVGGAPGKPQAVINYTVSRVSLNQLAAN